MLEAHAPGVIPFSTHKSPLAQASGMTAATRVSPSGSASTVMVRGIPPARAWGLLCRRFAEHHCHLGLRYAGHALRGLCGIVLGLVVCGGASAADWPDWRGPMQDRHYDCPPLVTSFDPESGENVAWTHDEGGISTPVVMGGRLYMLVRHEPETVAEAEKVICLDARTGEKLWENLFNVYLSDVLGERVGWSAVVADPTTNTIFAQGVCGVLTAIDAVTGKTKWR